MHLKRIVKISFIIICLSAGLSAILNLPVTSKQGINYVVKSVRMPLYIKIIEFLDRDYRYRELSERICQGRDDEQDKALALLEWVDQNIKSDIPQGWPIVDDHVWFTIVRGYGVRDQFSDVFATLCNYAGLDAFFTWVYTVDRRKRIPLCFVKIEGKWTIFDPYYGRYFKNKDGQLADIEEIKLNSPWSVESLNTAADIDYTAYLDNLPSLKDIGLSRANIQSPLNRLLFELKKLKR